MTLQAVYKQFLAAPNSSVLAPNASLHYITTTTSFHGPTDIIKHLNSQRSQIKKNKEDLITVIEGQDALAVQTALSIEFLDNGGAFLPGLDDQFLSDRIVDIPVVSDAPVAAALHTPSHRPCLVAQCYYALRLLISSDFPLRIASHCQIRQRRQDRHHSAELGPGRSPQAARRHWQDWSQLAHPRQPGPNQTHRQVRRQACRPGSVTDRPAVRPELHKRYPRSPRVASPNRLQRP